MSGSSAPVASDVPRTHESRTTTPEVRPRQPRLTSLDALRGFDMFWITGGAVLLEAIARQVDWAPFTRVMENLCQHVDWEGFHFHDLIFPLFLFVIGVAMPFALCSRLERGVSRSEVLLKVIRRTVLLYVLGLVYYGLLEFKPFTQLRLLGVLQRLALCYGIAGVLMLYLSIRGQALVAALCLVGYYLVMRFVPVPGDHGGPWTMHGNLANYVDRLVFTRGQMWEDYGDPEGLLSTIPAVATALIGVFTGYWLRSSRPAGVKTLGMIAAGIVMIGGGYLWSLDMPIIKKLWTSSYVLVAGGWSLLLLAAFYWLIDVRGWKGWAFFFVVIGLNPITIYVGQEIVNFDAIGEYFLRGVIARWPDYKPIIVLAGGLAARWLFLLFLNRQRVYLRV